MYLDAILYIKDKQDSALSLRRSSSEDRCRSCKKNFDGLHSLACIKPIDKDLTKLALVINIEHVLVLKDLVVNMTKF